MQKISLFVFFLILATSLFSQTSKLPFNQALADSLGADQYGMKNYIFVLLKKGTGDRSDVGKVNELFAGHMKNIERLASLGKLVVAGPMGDNPNNYRGIFILNASTLAEANALLETDPAIKGKLLEPELYNWYGSAALPLYLKYHDAVKKQNF